MIPRRFVVLLVVSAALLAAATSAVAGPPPGWGDGGPGWWRIDPKSTFYRTNNDPKATSSFFFILAELPFGGPSAPLIIEVYGDYRMSATSADNRNILHGVFTRTPTILASNLQRRLPDA